MGVHLCWGAVYETEAGILPNAGRGRGLVEREWGKNKNRRETEDNSNLQTVTTGGRMLRGEGQLGRGKNRRAKASEWKGGARAR